MSEVTISAPSASGAQFGTFRIDPNRISGQGGPVFPQLVIPVTISLESVEPRLYMGEFYPTAEDPIQDYTLLQLYGKLFYNSKGISVQVADFHSSPMTYFSRDRFTNGLSLAIPLDLYRLQHMEQIKRRTYMMRRIGCPTEGRSRNVRVYRLWMRDDTVPHEGQGAVGDVVRRVRMISSAISTSSTSTVGRLRKMSMGCL